MVILIVPQINNWNEERKAVIENTATLLSLYKNLILTDQQCQTLIKNKVAL